MTSFSILTHNLLFGQAIDSLVIYLKKYKPEIVCLQEFKVEPEEIAKVESCGYKLADYSHSFFRMFKFYSVATFYNPKIVKHKNGESLSLASGAYEVLLYLLKVSKTKRTALSNKFILRNGKTINVCNLHLTPLTGTNKTRTKQLTSTLNHFHSESNRSIIVGDFNFPYRRKALEKIFFDKGFKEATDNIFYTYKEKYFGLFTFKGKYDYIFFKGVNKKGLIRLAQNNSDHFPLLAKFTV
jgi:endonuclease/exonuclease/phosphatase family metal-dependent hydrolase